MIATRKGKKFVFLTLILLVATSFQLITQDNHEMVTIMKWCPKGVYAGIRYVNNARIIARDQLEDGLKVEDIIEHAGADDKYIDGVIKKSRAYVEAFLRSVEDHDGQRATLRRNEIVSGAGRIFIIYHTNAEVEARKITAKKNGRRVIDGKTMKAAYALTTDTDKTMYMINDEECIVLADKINVLNMMQEAHDGSRESMEYKIEELLTENVQKDADHIFVFHWRENSRVFREGTGDEEYLEALDSDRLGSIGTEIIEHRIDAEIKERITIIHSSEESLNLAVSKYRKGNLEINEHVKGEEYKGWLKHIVKTEVGKTKLIEEAVYRKPARERR